MSFRRVLVFCALIALVTATFCAALADGTAGVHVVAQTQPVCVIGRVKWDRTPYRPVNNPVVQGPLKGARVTAVVEGATQQVETDAQGAFKLAVPTGSFTFDVQASGYVPVRIPITLHPGPNGVTVADFPTNLDLKGDGFGYLGAEPGSPCLEFDAELVPVGFVKAQSAAGASAEVARVAALTAATNALTAATNALTAARTVANINAFNDTLAAGSAGCQGTISTINMSHEMAKFYLNLDNDNVLVNWWKTAAAAKVCSINVQAETSAAGPARLPQAVLKQACAWLKAYFVKTSAFEDPGSYYVSVTSWACGWPAPVPSLRFVGM